MEECWYESQNSEDGDYEYEYVLSSSEEEEEDIPEGVENLNAHPPSPPVQEADNDQSIFLSESINQSKDFLERFFSQGIHKLKKTKNPGLIIMRLEDFCQIRNQCKSHPSPIPHIIVIPRSGTFVRDHYDFTSCLDLWYPRK